MDSSNSYYSASVEANLVIRNAGSSSSIVVIVAVHRVVILRIVRLRIRPPSAPSIVTDLICGTMDSSM